MIGKKDCDCDRDCEIRDRDCELAGLSLQNCQLWVQSYSVFRFLSLDHIFLLDFIEWPYCKQIWLHYIGMYKYIHMRTMKTIHTYTM